MTETEKNLVVVIQRLIAAISKYAARHHINRCFCNDCNNTRLVINYAAKTIEPLQPPDL